jgi:hypothetical protein
LSIADGCDTSTNRPELTVRNSKLPPGGGRAAGGGSKIGRRRRVTVQPSQAKRATWLAVVRLGGADNRYAVQSGKTVTYVDGATALCDLLAFVSPRGGRGGDET